MNVLKEQYNLVRHTRESLFRFCETLDPKDYTRKVEGFGWGSVRNLHVHVAECYQNWLAKFGMQENLTPVEPGMVQNVKEMREVFEQVNMLMLRFLETYEGRYGEGLERTWHGDKAVLSPLWLFTHTITHEFHHKGQIVSMARQMRYIPADTDLLPPEDIEALYN
ncbi:DinB family protein [Virgibacillus siamensis]|uniref:DinB family protein n=1 Tax=Virgibacillus siamensis TaxID=480071 RepID=UPI000984BA9B|nr:DinB family protein [Virgibacillus siamensis]